MSKSPAVMKSEPPYGIRASMAGVLLDGKIGLREVAVMILELSAHGWFAMEQEREGNWGLLSASRLPPSSQALSPAEHRLLATLFRPSLAEQTGDAVAPQYVSLATLRHRLQGHVEEIGELLGQEMVEAGLVTKNPTSRGLTRASRLFTETGQRAAAEMREYQAFLKNSSPEDEQAPCRERVLRERLAYATALGVVDAWVERLELAGTPPETTAILTDIRANPLVYGVASAAHGSLSLDTILTVRLAESYGARLSPPPAR